MICMLQNILHYTGDYMSKAESLLNSTTYPEQNPDFINKLLFVPYRNENDITRNFRLCISKKQYPLFEGNKGPAENFCRVLRFDAGAPYKAILVDLGNNIIVADTREILKYTIYPRYKYSKYRGFEEAHLPMTTTWDEFNEEYNSEKMWIIHEQDEVYLGRTVYVEYFSDIMTLPHGDTLIEPSARGNENARHFQDYLDNVYRAREKAYVIRADENGAEGEIVVVIPNDVDNTKKYVLGTEAYFYIDMEDMSRKRLLELGLWH